MKIYINEFHQIKAVRVNNTEDKSLKEIEVDNEFLQGYCDTVKCAFCYHKWTDESDNEVLSIYPYKDFSVLEIIQAEHNLQEQQTSDLMETAVENDYRISLMELGLN